MNYFARPSLDGVSFQSLATHILNVANAAALIGKRIGLEHVCFLAGVLHDMGKFSREFQGYIRRLAKDILNNKKSQPSNFDHGVYGAAFLRKHLNKVEVKASELLQDMIDTILFELIGMCVCYHHGGLEDYVSVDGTSSPIHNRISKMFSESMGQTPLDEVVEVFFEQMLTKEEFEAVVWEARIEVLNVLKKQMHTQSLEQSSFDWHLIVKYVYSCLIDADRLDAYNYVSEAPLATERTILPHLDTYLNHLDDLLAFFRDNLPQQKSARKIADLRAEISKQCALAGTRETGIYTLSVPTGGGKTLASLRFALEHVRHHRNKTSEKTKIIFVLPYTTIIEQNADEIRKTLKCKSEELLEHHSNVSFSGDDHEDERKYKLLTERWDAPIIFTTQVQFFNTLFGGGSGDIRKLHTLANSVIILDEVQTIPLKCTYISNAALNTLSKLLNSTVLLCTATQANLGETKVPLQLSSPASLVKNMQEISQAFKRMEVIDSRVDAGDSLDSFVDWLVGLASEADSILVVMNTKRGVQNVVEYLEKRREGHRLYYLTTNLCAAHRKKIISEIRARLDTDEKIIVVSTNLIECGVDLSFEYVVRNMSGLPSVVQASGRGNRHGMKQLSFSYVVDVPEHLGPMSELKIAQKCMRELLYSFAEVPESFGNGLLTQASIDLYYKFYFGDQNIMSQMGYPIKLPFRNLGVDIYDLLSEQEAEVIQSAKKIGLKFSYPFRLVGKTFQVIEQNTRTLVVPYNDEARDLQSWLLSASLDIKDRRSVLRACQQYVVNVFDHDFKKLHNEAALAPVDGVEDFFILRDGFYSELYGIADAGESTLPAIMF